jgi:hypothetical protein
MASNTRIAAVTVACVAALVTGCGSDTGGAANTSAAAPNPTGARFPDITADDPASLYRTANFDRLRTIAAVYVGKRARVRSIRLVPGGAHISLALGDGLGRDISIDSTGGYLSADVAKLPGDPPTFVLSALDTASPEKLATQVGGPVDHMTASPGSDGGIHWAAYPAGGGPVYRLTTHPPR